MNDALLPAAKAIEELEPAVEAFAKATGLVDPVRELNAWLTDLIRYQRAPYQAKLLMRAAEKVKQSGIPAQAVSDKLLRAVLEDGPMEDSEDMQERWANLLANAATQPYGRVPVALARILAEMEPAEAATLDQAADDDRRIIEYVEARSWYRLDAAGFDNLARLELVRYQLGSPETIADFESGNTNLRIKGLAVTDLGLSLVTACQAPGSSDP